MKKVLVVAHDAGGAEIIAAYIAKNRRTTKFIAYVAGPAAVIFRRMKLPFHKIEDNKDRIASIMRKYRDVDFALLASPGWMTSIEATALQEAKKQGLTTVVYLDSWVHYRERFGLSKKVWQNMLPDVFWAGDQYALALAKKTFPVPVKFVRNEYFENIKKRYHAAKRPTRPAVLFLSTALSTPAALKEILRHLSQEKNPMPLRIRFHPADDTKRYDDLVAQYPMLTIEKSKEKDIVRDLAQAKVVVGTESAAMAAAVLVGIKTISMLRKGQKHYLPFPAIRRVYNAKALHTFL